MYKGDKQMKIYKKNKKIESTLEETRKAIDAAPEDMQEMDNTIVQFTEEEIMTLKEVLPRIVQLLTGEATIEVIEDDEDMEIEEPEDMDEVKELGQGDQEVTLPKDMEMEEAKDEATFDAMAVLNDPKKKAALIEALKGQKTTAQKVGDMMEPKAEDKDTPAKKVFVKKTLPKKAGDEQPVVKKPNSELVKTPVVRKVGDSSATTVRTFDFHKK
jgi:hypothetical protein